MCFVLLFDVGVLNFFFFDVLFKYGLVRVGVMIVFFFDVILELCKLFLYKWIIVDWIVEELV